MPTQTLSTAISAFGKSCKAKLANPAAAGAPEDQLRAPLEGLFQDLSALARVPNVTLVGESTLGALSTRPDYAVTVQNALVGFIEVKAPGRGADPRRFTDEHDKKQWTKLKSLPNLLYTDGNSFSLWRDGQLVDKLVELEGDVETAGAKLAAPAMLLPLIGDFLTWTPTPPRSVKQLAETAARLCRLLRDEVTEELQRSNPGLTSLAQEWRGLLFPQATDAEFADGYAQAVTFGLLVARAKDIELKSGIDKAALELRKSNSLIGTALRLLTDSHEVQKALDSALRTLARVLDAVDWPSLTKGDVDAWLYFYEDFLAVYDNALRKRTGSYYTPPEVVTAMVRLVDEALRDPALFALPQGLASREVTLADPAVGTGAYLLGAMRSIAQTVENDLGPGAVPGAIASAVERLIGFEMQFGPFAVAQLRLMAEIQTLMGVNDASSLPALRLFITDTLGDPYAAQTQFSALTQPIGESRKQANKIKREENITVVIGNPPYKEKAKGRGKGEGARRLDRVRERHIFQGVQQPVCIVLAARPLGKNSKEPAHLRFRSLPAGKREGKFDALSEVSLAGKGWIDGPNGWRDPFLPFFVDSSPGMLAGRTWVIAPDSQTLGSRWDALVAEKSPETKEVMFSPTMRRGQLADRHTQKVVRDGLAGHEIRAFTVASDAGKVIAPTRFGFRSFDRQWLIPDNRLLLSARPEMWRAYSNQQTYVTALDAHSPSNGPSLTLTGLIPDQHHYKGSFGGRVFPLWRDAAAKVRT